MEGSRNLLITDRYMLTMCYMYFKDDKHNKRAVFEYFYRKNPFNGNVNS